ncbi:carbohydrate porin [Methylobacterium sp. NEAU 140]|uniref:carbohydrate porin n=1 Tax=Methylobacterium sp. NEAU 140 TaxID=3064945 RepID=UPI002736A26E|nr:carbohydrate porin [Methylobacterium sp. NEAU 140]MDP4025811.1 carbohydrate porin [Methylobacterium sp. NEAU 140]
MAAAHGAPGMRAAAAAVWALAATAAAAQGSRPVYEGAGNDPRVSVAQPESTSQSSGGYMRSIAPALGPIGDPLGLRPTLKARGIEYGLSYFLDILGNPRGGVRRGAIVEDRLNLRLNLDLERLAGWEGATAHANAYFIHGTGLSRYYVGNLLTTSVIEALPSSRLYVLWLDQQLFDNTLGVRIGQQGADTEFFVSQTATLFVNSTFGWPAITGLDLPSGGPAYPLATPAIRAKYVPGNGFSLQVGLYDGDPAGANRPGNTVDPQRLDPAGTAFRLRDPALLIAEATYAYNTRPGSAGLPGDITIGGWRHAGRFASLRTDITGLPLADPNAAGFGRRLRGNAGIYAIYDQTLYQEPGKDDEGLGFFVRAAYSPSRSSLIDAYLDAGLAYRGLIPGRDADTVGVSVAYARIGGDARGADDDTIRFTGRPMPRRRAESVIEVTYQAVVAPGFTVQPDVQLVLHPGGGIADPRDPNAGRVKNALVLGIRAAVHY